MARALARSVTVVTVFLSGWIWAVPGRAAAAGENSSDPPVSTNYVPPAARDAQAGLPPYDYNITDGLYATITANSYDEPKLPDGDKVKLNVPGFQKDLEVRVLWQSGSRPLAVLLPGLASRAKDKITLLWKSYLYQAGFHVLTFDSPFLPAFSERSRHGVAGSLEEEARLVANLVEAFLKDSQARARVTQTGLVGVSYGGALALNIAKLAAQGKVSFTPKRVLAFSPPVSMKASAAILDQFYSEDRWKYTLADLADDLMGHKPVPPGHPIPFSAAEMRAGVAAAFRLDLKEVVEFDDRMYKLGLLPERGQYDDEYRRDYAGTWSFTQFIEQMSYPYWAPRAHLRNPEDLWRMGDLAQLLPACPDTVHVVLAADDPLTDPSELEALKKAVNPARLTVLPHGGHTGYNNTKWVKALVAKLFE